MLAIVYKEDLIPVNLYMNALFRQSLHTHSIYAIYYTSEHMKILMVTCVYKMFAEYSQSLHIFACDLMYRSD